MTKAPSLNPEPSLTRTLEYPKLGILFARGACLGSFRDSAAQITYIPFHIPDATPSCEQLASIRTDCPAQAHQFQILR